ncbi:MAG: HPr family phosphocarrier protein [Parachlamydiales bacterium]|nr:HPr family phosphocarrier protein [Parachlamydiales bacterium]
MQEQKKNIKKASFIVKNVKGLHTRPSTELVKCSSSFNSTISLIYKNYHVNAKSLLGILMLAASKGSKITIEADGEDAEKAVDTIVNLANNNFNIKY